MFVYLDLPGQIGPARVRVQSATLSTPNGPVALKWVDNGSTRAEPGTLESADVTFELSADRTALYDPTDGWVVDSQLLQQLE